MKKIVGMILAAVMFVTAFAGCSNEFGESASNSPSITSSATASTSSFNISKEISVVSREEGSGTRSAFIELFGVEQKDSNGNKMDYTTEDALITNNTSVMMTTVAGNTYAIGYISLGSLNDTVKALEIGGAEATVQNIENGSYKIVRPFNVVTKSTLSEVAQDFLDFILSATGQAVIEKNGYISVSDAPAYSASKLSGKIELAGSSSVTPVMEKLKEAYIALNPNVTIEVQQSDSSTGISSAIEGICDIGMASRDLKDSESAESVTSTVIARDGIAVIINKNNPLTGLTAEQVKKIFTGETTLFSEIMD